MNTKISAEPSVLSPPPPLFKDPILWLALGLYLLYGAVYNFLPVTFPILRDTFGSTFEQMGQTQSLFFVSALVFSALGGWFISQLGTRTALIVALLFLSLALITVGLAPSFGVVLLGAFCFGLAMSAIVVIVSSMVSDHFGAKRQTVFFLMGICDSSGSIVGPAALGWWFAYSAQTGLSWRLGYYFSAALAATFVLWAIRLRYQTGQSTHETATPPTPAPFTVMREVLSKPTIYAIGLLAFLHGQAQGGAISFIGQLYQQRLRVDAAEAAFFISVNSAGLFAGRFILSWVTSRWKIPELLVLSVCALGGSFCFVGTILAPGYFWGLALFTFAGMFVSGNGPSISSFVGLRFVGRTATAFALFAGMSSIGAAAGSYLIGFFGTRLGVETAIWLVPVFSLALAASAFIWYLRDRLTVTKQASAPEVEDRRS